VPENLEEQLVKYLTDVHSIEEQALTQMRRAPEIAGDEQLAGAFREHLVETESHESRVRDRLAAHGAEPSTVKDVAARAGGFGMVLFARSQPDTPGKLTAHAFSYEHLELAAHELLGLAADRAGDAETASAARSIREEESAMAERLAASFDAAVAASLREVEPDDLESQLESYLSDVHAIESQALQLLEQGPLVARDPGLEKAFRDHLEETRSHQAVVTARLEAHGAKPSRFKSVLLRLGGVNMGAFFGAQPDTTAKLAGFAFAFEHLEVASYELLRRVAERAGDEETARVATRIAGEERAAAAAIRSRFRPALDVTLGGKGVTATP
jgi:ferritin-like metal-binding protein YciE